MNGGLRLIVILMATAALTSSCSRSLRILFINNTGQAISLRFESDESSAVKNLDVSEQATVIYEFPAKIFISTSDCRFSYELPPYDHSYDKYIPSPRERPYRIELQIEADYQIYIIPSGSELPVTNDNLDDQPGPFFPVSPSQTSCA